MAHSNPYPQNLRVRVHQLYYIDGKPMTEVIPILKQEFPLYVHRITLDRMHSVARGIRVKLDLPAKVQRQSEAAKKREARKAAKHKPQKQPKSTKHMASAAKEDVIAAARKLRQKKYRWGAIVEELRAQFPDANVPGPGPLANLVKGKKAKSENNKYHIAITGPSGVTLNMTVSTQKTWERILQNILEG
jgi:hypothetical protein